MAPAKYTAQISVCICIANLPSSAYKHAAVAGGFELGILERCFTPTRTRIEHAKKMAREKQQFERAFYGQVNDAPHDRTARAVRQIGVIASQQCDDGTDQAGDELRRRLHGDAVDE